MFEKAVSRGLMTVTRAQGFLMLVKAEVKKSAVVYLMDGLKPTGAGRLVMQWLRSSGQENELAFLANPAFRHILMQFAVAEGLDDTVWSWFEKLIKHERASELPGVFFTPKAGFLLGDFVAAKSCDRELEGAFAAVLKAEAMIKEAGAPLDSLRRAWGLVALETTMHGGEGRTPPASIFDSFVALGRAARSQRIDLAHINLYHPVNPSANLAVKFLSGKKAYEGILRPHDVEEMDFQRPFQPQKKTLGVAARLNYIHHLKYLGVDAVQHLLHSDQRQEASRLWEILDSRLGWLSTPTAV